MKTHTRFVSMLTFTLSLLLTVQAAHADFRKALEAYQARDGAAMLKEVKDAVDKKNDDGLVLFLSCLQFDSTLSTSLTFIGNEESEYIYQSVKNGAVFQSPWESILNINQKSNLLTLLEKATSRSSLESQHRLLQVRYGDIFDSGSINEMDKNFIKENNEKYFEGLADLAEKGYVRGAYFLEKYNYFPKIPNTPKLKTSAYWHKKVIEQNYKNTCYSNESSSHKYSQISDLTKQPVISIHRFLSWNQGTSFTFNNTNYLIDIYVDGRINFAIGPQLDCMQNEETLYKISQKDVAGIVALIDKFGIKNIPHKNVGDHFYGDDLLYPPPTFHRHVPRHIYSVTLRNEKDEQKVIFLISDKDTPPLFLAQTLNLIETKIPTQKFRCGSVSSRQYYQYCLNQDKKMFEIAKLGETK